MCVLLQVMDFLREKINEEISALYLYKPGTSPVAHLTEDNHHSSALSNPYVSLRVAMTSWSLHIPGSSWAALSIAPFYISLPHISHYLLYYQHAMPLQQAP